jgi:hypothetical protein
MQIMGTACWIGVLVSFLLLSPHPVLAFKPFSAEQIELINETPDSIDANTLRTQLDCVKDFANAFMQGYESAVLKTLPSEFYDSLTLNPNKNVRVSVILSKCQGSFMSIFNSDSVGIEIHYTLLPAQYKIICGLFPNICNEFRRAHPPGSTRAEDFFRIYDSIPPSWEKSNRLRTRPWYMSDAEKFVLRSPKLIDQADSNLLVAIQSIFIDSSRTSKDTVRFARIDQLAIFNGDTSFCWALNQLKTLGEFATIAVFGFVIHQYWDKSEFLRRALINDEAKELATEITRIEHRMERDRTFEIEPYRLKARKERLLRMMTANNIDTSYITEVMANARARTEGGKIFWYADSNSSFSWQWVLVNLMLLIAILVVRLVHSMTRKLASISGILEKLHYVTAPFILFLNGWVFGSRVPQNLSWDGFLLPLFSLGLTGLVWFVLTSSFRRTSGSHVGCPPEA